MKSAEQTRTATRRVRAGLVGVGFGSRVHLPALLAHPRFEVVALASPHNAQAIASERGIAGAYASCEEMVGAGGLDAVVVASPPFAHHADVIAALGAGLHVLCEKPFALDVAQAQEMLAAATRAGTACGVAHEFRFVPQRMAIKQMIVNGHVSPLRQIEITQLLGFLRAEGTRTRGWWFERSRGGGLAGALLSHLVDTATWLAGKNPLRTTGLLRTANPHRRDAAGTFDSDVDDGAFAVLDYGDGVVARIAADATAAVSQFTLAVHGESRTAVASGTSMTDMRLFSVDDDETDELQCKPSPYARFASINDNVPLMMELYDEWVRQMQSGASALPTFAEAVATQRALAAIGYGA